MMNDCKNAISGKTLLKARRECRRGFAVQETAAERNTRMKNTPPHSPRRSAAETAGLPDRIVPAHPTSRTSPAARYACPHGIPFPHRERARKTSSALFPHIGGFPHRTGYSSAPSGKCAEPCGNWSPASDKILERAEIYSPRPTGYWSGRKFIPHVRQGTGTGGNLFPTSDRTLARAEIRCLRPTRYWSERKLVARVRQGTGTDGNSLPAPDKVLARVEICSPRPTRGWSAWKLVAARCAAHRVLPCLHCPPVCFAKTVRNRRLYLFTYRIQPPQRVAEKIYTKEIQYE